jgi:hypothetical protein
VNLNISNNGIGDAGQMLVSFLNKTGVVRLNLAYFPPLTYRYTRLTETSFSSFLKGLEANRSVQDLDLSGNNLTTNSLQALFKLIPVIKIQNLVLKVVHFR